MTKWVTLLLLLLAALSYGLSQLRPSPPEETPVAVEIKAPEPSETPASDLEPSTQTAPVAVNPAARKRIKKAPNFGLPGQATDSTADAKADPKSEQQQKAKKQPVTGKIKAISFATSADGGSRTKFPLDVSSIYVTATPEGLDDSTEVVANFRSVRDAKAEFSSPVASSGPPRRRLFRLTPDEKGWLPGPYQVTFTATGTDQVLGLGRFEILAEDEKLPKTYPAPEYMDLLADPAAESPQTTFNKKNENIYLLVSAQALTPGTAIRTVWSAVEVDRLTAGELIDISSQPAPGEGKDLLFTFGAPPGGFHTGSYKVDVYFEQELAGSQVFFVQPPPRTTANP